MNPFSRSLRTFAAAAVAGCALLAAPAASAQTPIPTTNGEGFDLRLFRPAVDSKGLFSVNGTDILGANDFSFGLVVDAGFNMLRIGQNGTGLVQNQFNGTLLFNYGIGNVLVVGAQLPIHLLGGPGSTDPALQGVTGAQYQPPSQGLSYPNVLGDISFHVKLRWLRAEYFPVGLAIIVQGGFGIPGLDPARFFVGEPAAYLWPQVAVEWRPTRRLRVDINAGFRIPFGTGSTISGNGVTATYGPSITWGLGIGWRPTTAVELVAETYGQQYVSAGDFAATFNTEALLGLRIFVDRNSYLMIGGGSGFRTGYAAADGRALLGFTFEPSIGDTDGDGYRDDTDQCVNDPEDFDGFQDDDGCSEPDNDRDGIPDTSDQCPNVPEDRDGDHDEDGCPEGQESDRDGDGILDNADQCPDEPEDRDSFQDTDGCPDPDNDQDTIPDTVDNCPNDPEDMDSFQDDDGCPDPDNDQDGIPDVRDRCPNEPEVMNGVDDDDGCPDSGDLQILGNVINLREQIQFETDSAEIRAISFPIIEQMANLLRRNPQFELVEVEGHTDVRANDEHNLRLSNDRANAVRQALVQRGIDPNRLVAAGYGEYCPLDPRNNAAAWERNRRVQFIIVRTHDEGRTTAAAGCRRAAQYIPPTVGPPGTGVARERSGGSSAAPGSAAPPAASPAPANSTPASPAAAGSATPPAP